ncbi:phospholipase D-like domain-containing protein [Streptomyces sp. B1866]|uniref:phospholipase D family protein n=1 Tax=Streptomyces sp. B1866 TaxID=3075431 RepID=UPI00288DF969|nr:phospholipase D-like domain-containing protein [Streptomyces sp. B1866]MDT3396570.1 phospholipase D-like domain-containing protein [Streptomyces sp. B1866]
MSPPGPPAGRPGGVVPPAAPVPPAPPAAPAPAGTRPAPDCTKDAAELAKLPRSRQRPLRGTARSGGRWPATGGNQVVGYTTGRCCFNDIAAAIDTATQPAHRVYLAGWWISPDTWLRDPPAPPAKTPYLLSDVLRGSPAQIRSLTWRPPVVFGAIPDNKPWVDFVNGLPNGAAIGDGKLPGPRTDGTGGLLQGVHHQKIVVVVGYRGTIAFLGGMDLNNTRISNQGVEPLHDVHLRLTGPAAARVLETFKERWTDHPDAPALEAARFGAGRGDPFRGAFPDPVPQADARVPTVTLPPGARRQDRVVRVGRTYADLRRFQGSAPYAFAPGGEHTALDMLVDGIRTARETIYVEDQYLSSAIVRAELVKKLAEPGFRQLLLLVCNSDAIATAEFGFLRIFRNEFRRDLLAADPGKSRWGMYALKPCPDPVRRWFAGEYVHSKTWIFDDEYAIVGSANCTDRSYTFDSEITAGVGESGFVPPGPDAFAGALRVSLWHKHLGVPHNLVRDWTAGLKVWRKPPPSAMIFDASALETDPTLGVAFPQDAGQTEAVRRGREFYDTDGLH